MARLRTIPPERRKDHSYSGKFSDQQLYGKNHEGTKYKRIEYSSLTDYQNFLYNRVMYGLAVYPREMLDTMHKEKKDRITSKHKQCQTVLNLWKQQIMNRCSTELFRSLFPDSEFTKLLEKTESYVDPKVVNKTSFTKLGVGKEQIIAKLVNDGILPHNFYNIKEDARRVSR